MGIKIKQLDEWQNRESAAGFTRTNSSTITVTNNADNQGIFKVGLPVRYRDTGSYLYGVITGYSSGAVTISGVSLPTTINDFQVGPVYKLNQVVLFVPGTLSQIDDQYRAVSKTRLPWLAPTSYVVQCYAAPDTAASGSSLIIEPVLSTSGIQRDLLSPSTMDLGTSSSFVGSGVGINSTNYEVLYNDEFDFNVTQVGSTTAGSDITVIFVVINE